MKKTIKMKVPQGIKSIVAVAIIALMFVTNSKAQDNQGVTVVASVTATATVKKIDHKSREVTVLADDGEEFSFVASSDVKNLAQVKKGDKITIVYAESIAYQIRKHGDAALTTTGVAVVAAPGAKPAGAVAQQSMLSVKITEIDLANSEVTVVGPQGNSRTINVQDPQKLQGLQVGDIVDLTYTEAIAIKVDAAPKK